MDGIRTPMVFGILRPQVYLPVGMNLEFYDCVLQHERMHLRRLDYLWKILAYLIGIVHWVNPVVWLASPLPALQASQRSYVLSKYAGSCP